MNYPCVALEVDRCDMVLLAWLQADFDDDVMQDLERKRREREQEATEHRQQLRRSSIKMKEATQLALDAELAVGSITCHWFFPHTTRMHN